MTQKGIIQTTLPRIVACILILSALCGVCMADTGSWSTNGPLTTGTGDKIIHALAVSPDGTIIYCGTGNGRVFSFTLSITTTLPAPTVSLINPATGINTGTVTATITGSHFNTTSGYYTTVNLTKAGETNISVTGITPGSSSSLTVDLPLTGASTGTWDVIVVNPDGQESTESVPFTITKLGVLPAPTLDSINPATGENSGTVTAMITGSHFNTTSGYHTTVNLTRTGYTNISVFNLHPALDTSFAVNLPITGAAVGTWYVVVINPDGQESTESVPFLVKEPGSLPAPSVVSINPATGVNTGTVIATITGSHFNTTPGYYTTVNLTRAGYANILVFNLHPALDTSFAVNLPITGAAAGTWHVVVINPDGQESMEIVAFTVTTTTPTTAPTTSPTTVPITIPTTTVTTVTTASSSGSGSDSSGDSGRAMSYVATSPGTGAGGTMTFAIGEPLSTGGTGYSYAIISITLVPSGTLGSTDLIVTDAGATSHAPDGRTVAGIVAISPVAVNPSAISSGTITFAVSGAWLSAHDLTPANIVLMRFHDGVWAELPTTYQYQSGNAYYFTATTPGFSYFAITSRAAGATSVNASASVTTLPESIARTTSVLSSSDSRQATYEKTGIPVAEQTTAVPAGAQAPVGSSGFPVTTVALIGAGCVVLICAGWFARRWWIRRQNPALFKKYD
jgi:PGF-pre-PGF domain-containing protein